MRDLDEAVLRVGFLVLVRVVFPAQLLVGMSYVFVRGRFVNWINVVSHCDIWDE